MIKNNINYQCEYEKIVDKIGKIDSKTRFEPVKSISEMLEFISKDNTEF